MSRCILKGWAKKIFYEHNGTLLLWKFARSVVWYACVRTYLMFVELFLLSPMKEQNYLKYTTQHIQVQQNPFHPSFLCLFCWHGLGAGSSAVWQAYLMQISEWGIVPLCSFIMYQSLSKNTFPIPIDISTQVERFILFTKHDAAPLIDNFD